MKKFLMTTSAIAVVMGLGACTSPDPGSPESLALLFQEEMENRTELMQDAIDNQPDWYSNAPMSDYAIYTVGRATSADMQFSVDMATLVARRELAGNLQVELSNMMKKFGTQIGDVMVAENESVTKSVIAKVMVVGTRTKEKDIQVENGQYVAYVLLEYPVGKANRMLVDQLKQSRELYGRIRGSEAYLELEREVNSQRGLSDKQMLELPAMPVPKVQVESLD